jgi:DNA methylase
MNSAEFTRFLSQSCRLLASHSIPASIHFICIDWRHLPELLSAGNQVYGRAENLCVWVKDRGGLGSLYRSQHELVLVFKNSVGVHQNNVRLGKFGRNRTNVWHYPQVNSFARPTDEQEGNLLAIHPTSKPVALVADAILDCSARGDIVLDSFLGSGTTLIAAERTGRVCCGIELDPLYADTIIRRWQAFTGDRAVHGILGQTFTDLEEQAKNGLER